MTRNKKIQETVSLIAAIVFLVLCIGVPAMKWGEVLEVFR